MKTKYIRRGFIISLLVVLSVILLATLLAKSIRLPALNAADLAGFSQVKSCSWSGFARELLLVCLSLIAVFSEVCYRMSKHLKDSK